MAYFEKNRMLPLPEIVSSPEFRSMPIEKKRAIMDLFNQQAGEKRMQDTQSGTALLASILSALMTGQGIAQAATLPKAIPTIEELARQWAPYVPKAMTVVR